MIFGGNVKIGVLGGIGPEATGEYYFRLIRCIQQTELIKDNTDFPYIIIHSIPAPELIGIISPEQLELYKSGLRELDNSNVNFIVMVCNTIHLYLKELQAEIITPILDLRQKVKERIFREKVQRVAVLGTPATIKNGLYRLEGIGYIELSERDIELLGVAIFRYNKGEDKTTQQQIVEEIARKCLDRGTETILLACTELAVMLKDVDIPKIDTVEVLVEGTIDFFRRVKQKDLLI